jgi:hypothetical protein
MWPVIMLKMYWNYRWIFLALKCIKWLCLHRIHKYKGQYFITIYSHRSEENDSDPARIRTCLIFFSGNVTNNTQSFCFLIQ